ncbi:MAG: amino acid decarboxylase [Deltaproteobacteria bacterium]|nr:amino acid decarboxylase [Deltaproteobacteria bacterium]
MSSGLVEKSLEVAASRPSIPTGSGPQRLAEEAEITLDPEDWGSLRTLGYRMVDDMFDHLARVRERPAWKTPPADKQALFRQPLPQTGEDPEAIYQEFLDHILDYSLGNTHPRFWGWVCGSGTGLGMLAEMLRAGMNTANVGHLEMANFVEYQVLDWCKEMFDFPEEASGLLVDGGSMANLIGICAARTAKQEIDLRIRGLAASPRRMLLYASDQVHSSVLKAAELLGLGRDSVRIVRTNSRFEVDMIALARQIDTDRRAGHHPFCIVGTAGTVNTGAFDDLVALADLAEEEQMWLHVDGAFGAFVALSGRLRHLVEGMERADSLAFDLHKWMHMPYDVGCILVRSRPDHRNAFELIPDYIASSARGTSANPDWFSNYGPQLSRSFRALKVWMSIKEHGLSKYARLIEQNVDQVKELERLIRQSSPLEVVGPVVSNVLNYRYSAEKMGEEQLNRLNRELLEELQVRGIAVPSSTLLGGKFVIRVANTNHRTRFEDFRALVDHSLLLGSEICENLAQES